MGSYDGMTYFMNNVKPVEIEIKALLWVLRPEDLICI